MGIWVLHDYELVCENHWSGTGCGKKVTIHNVKSHEAAISHAEALGWKIHRSEFDNLIYVHCPKCAKE